MKNNINIIKYIIIGIGVFFILFGIIMMNFNLEIDPGLFRIVNYLLMGIVLVLWFYYRHLRKEAREKEINNEKEKSE